MHFINPYVEFNGKCLAAMNFYQQCFGKAGNTDKQAVAVTEDRDEYVFYDIMLSDDNLTNFRGKFLVRCCKAIHCSGIILIRTYCCSLLIHFAITLQFLYSGLTYT